MPPEAVPSNASVASTGLGLRYIGKEHCYALSGNVTIGNTKTDLLNFTSGSGYIVGKLQIALGDATTDDFEYEIKFNDIGIFVYSIAGSHLLHEQLDNFIPIIIPPQTLFSVNGDNLSSATGRANYAMLTGRVYGAD